MLMVIGDMNLCTTLANANKENKAWELVFSTRPLKGWGLAKDHRSSRYLSTDLQRLHFSFESPDLVLVDVPGIFANF